MRLGGCLQSSGCYVRMEEDLITWETEDGKELMSSAAILAMRGLRRDEEAGGEGQ